MLSSNPKMACAQLAVGGNVYIDDCPCGFNFLDVPRNTRRKEDHTQRVIQILPPNDQFVRFPRLARPWLDCLESFATSGSLPDGKQDGNYESCTGFHSHNRELDKLNIEN